MENSFEEIDITPSTRLLEVLGDIPLQPWQCLAELIDNALDELVKDQDRFRENPLRIDIDIEERSRGNFELVIRDNGCGMTVSELTTAVKAGATSKGRYGTLGLFGMGFNIATARLGRSTQVLTATKHADVSVKTTLDFAELQRTEKFRAPLERMPKTFDDVSGTEVRILLKPTFAEYFSKPANLNVVRNQLGNVYSYLLRKEVPGISRHNMSAMADARIYVAGERVKPKLPCIWADSRSVQSYGQAIEAVQYIDIALTDATACLTCGYWDRSNGPDCCEECGSTKLELRPRRIWGWIGVQRYIDSSHYGIDFLRYGRKILMHDKGLFRYTDPDTLQEDVEYPIEMPANRGRIVGEIHLDHVPVTYQKNDFDRQNRDWTKALEMIRGEGPMKPRGARNENTSYLAKIFSAYRRNDPGLKCLTPGDGARALHAKAKEWASHFDKEVPRYVEDTEWYEAARRHDEFQSPSRSKGETPGENQGAQRSNPPDTASSAFNSLIGDHTPASDGPSAPIKPIKLTRAQILGEAKIAATERPDLSGTFVLGGGLGEWKIRVLETNRPLIDEGENEQAATVSSMTGSEIEVLVNREDVLFKDFGRDIRDVAILQASEAIYAMSRSSLGVAGIYSLIVKSIEDLRVTPISLQENARSLLQRAKELMFQVSIEQSSALWDHLTSTEKQGIEIRAAGEYPNDSLEALVDDGRFVLLLDGKSMASLIHFDPLRFFDNRVFRASLEHRNEVARRTIVNRVTRNLEGLGDFLDDANARQADDIAMARVQIEILARQLRPTDTL